MSEKVLIKKETQETLQEIVRAMNELQLRAQTIINTYKTALGLDETWTISQDFSEFTKTGQSGEQQEKNAEVIDKT